MSLALARKYRPATFNDLIGQEAVSQTLSLALDNQRLSHAYLFSGLRGSGKTSTARIFAKALLCEKGASSHPCGECTHCIMAAENRHMDIIEMDAASNRGIDDIKDLIEHTKYKPSSARYKIFIIDEVHMLTNQAFNALLKTLEEPPDFVKFILATTDPLKLPATILSRTQHFRFKKIPQPLVEKHLEHILNLEKIGFEKEAVEIIARTGAGSLRDSLTLLDQAIVYSQNHVDVATVTGMLGIIEPGKLEKLLNDIMQKDTDAILTFIRDASDYEAEMILDELTLYLKSLLLEGSGKLSAMIIERFFRIIAEAKSLLALGSDGEFVLSLTLFKMTEALQIKDIDAMIKGLEQELKGVEVSEIVITSPAPDLSAPKEVITITEDEILAPAEAESVPDSGFRNAHLFDDLVKKIYDRDYDLGNCFEQNITFVSFKENLLTWESTAEDEDKEMLAKHWSFISMFIKELFGAETKIRNIAKKKHLANSNKQASEGSGNHLNTETPNLKTEQPKAAHNDADSSSMIEDIEIKSSCIAPDAGDTEAAKEKDSSTLLEEPMIKTAMELFSPKKVRIKKNV